MEFTKAIYLMNGEAITITEKEFGAIVKSLENEPEGFVRVQGQLINKRSIAKIGNHHATADIKKWNESNLDRALIGAGRADLVEAKQKILKEKTLNQFRSQDEMFERLRAGDPEAIRHYNAMPDEPKKVMTADETERGDAEYWIDDNGAKHFA